MPIYEYHCKACGYETEVLQKMSDKPLRKCPACGRMQMQRLISAPSFRLKGDGWYETDFKSDKEKKRNIAGEKPEKSDGKKKDKSASSSDSPKKSDGKADNKSGGKPSSSAVA